MRPRSVAGKVWLLLACASWCMAQRTWTAADMLAVKSIGEVRPSPDGKTILFTVESVDLASNRNVSQLMRITAAGGDPAPVKGAPVGAASVRWAPDGARVAYIASDAIWVLDIASGKPARVCNYYRSNGFLSKAGNMLAWSPDGSQIVFAGTLEPAPPPQDPIVVTRVQYKGRTALVDNRRTHIHVVAASGGTPRALTNGPTDEHSIAWGDGSEIVFLSNHEPDPDARLNYDIFAVNVKSGAVRQITRTPGVEMDPRVSSDGRFIAYTATRRELTTIDSVAEDAHAWVVPGGGGKAVELNADLDRRTSSIDFAPGPDRVVYTAIDHGSTMICSTVVSTTKSSCEIGRGAQAGSPAVARDGSITFTMSTPDKPVELYRLDPNSRTPRQLTRINAAFSQYPLSKAETLSFKSSDGTLVEGWLYPAIGTGSRTGMILSIHGGPHGAFGFGFNPQFQFYASRGYAVLAINPRGSTGYGQKFSDGCVNDWGGGDYRDLMAGVDHALATHASIDSGRLFVTGSSYGGFMTNWVITQTNRFRAAVAGASLSNLISFYATSLYQDLIHAEFGGYPWTGRNFETLWKWSPLAYVAKAETPTMFIHGESDNDVHITQAEEMYTALRQRGVIAELVRYPREGHGFREPKHRLDAAERTVAWFDRFSK